MFPAAAVASDERRRETGTRGRKSFVCIRTRAKVPRDPSPEVYRGVRDAYKTLMVVTTILVQETG